MTELERIEETFNRVRKDEFVEKVYKPWDQKVILIGAYRGHQSCLNNSDIWFHCTRDDSEYFFNAHSISEEAEKREIIEDILKILKQL